MGWLKRGTSIEDRLETIKANQTGLARMIFITHGRVLNMANDLSKLQGLIDQLSTKSDTVVATLGGLAKEVLALQGQAPVDQQVAIDALAAKAQSILDNLSAADTAAEAELPPATPAPAA